MITRNTILSATLSLSVLSFPAETIAFSGPQGWQPPLPYQAPVTWVNFEQNATRYFNQIRNQPPLLWMFLAQMPKGGDLHTHLSGAVYAETYFKWATEAGQCIDEKTLSVVSAPCDDKVGRPSAKVILEEKPALYKQTIDTWSMRNFEYSDGDGHDRFFDAFGKFGEAQKGKTANMLVEVATRAQSENASYLEVMVTVTDKTPNEIAKKLGWDGKEDFAKLREAILANGLSQSIEGGRKWLDDLETQYRQLLHCGTDQAAPACNMVIRYVHQVKRVIPPEQVFATMLAGFELVKADPRVVSLNLVAPEDNSRALQDYSLQMRMLNYLKQQYPQVNLTLHAGELVLGLVPPEDLRYHIREAVQLGQAKRIGHGVDIMYEDNASAVLKEMAQRKVMVEICLSSNDFILGVKGREHPLSAYLQWGVPATLATDDLGIARSNMTREYQKAVEEQGLDYLQLKMMARNSLEYSFVEGTGYWQNYPTLMPVAACASDNPQQVPSPYCQQFLQNNPKAWLQRNLEAAFMKFEQTCCS